MKLLHHLLNKGQHRDRGMVEQLFKNVLGFLKHTSSVTGYGLKFLYV